MAYLSKAVSRIYLNSINGLFNQLYTKLDPKNSNPKAVEKVNKSAQETFFRILIILFLIVAISLYLSTLLGDRVSFYSVINDVFLIYATATIGAFLSLFLIDEYSSSTLIKDYQLAAKIWNRRDLDKSEKKREIQAIFENKHNRDLRLGEIRRIINNAEKGISFRYDDYLYNDRLLFLKIFFYGPLLKDWDENILFSKLAKVFVLVTVFLTGPITLSLSYLFQEGFVDSLHWYVMRGIEPDFVNSQKGSEGSNGVIKEWQEDDFKKLCVQAYNNLEKKNVTKLKEELSSLIKQSGQFPNINYELDKSAFHKNKRYREWIRQSVGL